MEDLLKEDDFVKINPYYNPRKVFRVFYVIAFLQLVAIMLIEGTVDSVTLGFIAIGVVSFTPFIMAFYGRNIRADIKTLSIGLLILLAIYYIPIILIMLFSEVEDAIAILIAFIANYLFTLAIVIPIARRKHRHLKIQ
jgi:hypothetical protein